MFDKNELKQIYTTMVRMRRFEEAASSLYEKGQVTGSLHPYIGEEAIAAAAMAVMKKGDLFTSTHRGLGHCVACGMDLNQMMAELFGKATGICGGKGGSMHMFAPELGNLGTNGIVAGGTSIAVGAALTAKELRKNDAVVFCFFGEGAANEGVTHESMNLAAVWELPVIFVCENNLYQVFTTVEESCSVHDISLRAQGYGIPGETVDGNDVLAMEPAYRAAVRRARGGDGPSLIECKTYRWSGHWPGDAYSYGGYRTAQEVDMWKERCPIRRLGQVMVEKGIATAETLEAVHRSVDALIDAAVRFAAQSPEPDESELMRNLFV